MRPDPEYAHKTLLIASQALQRGDLQTARKLAEQAVALDPDSEECWLLMAALASPRASIDYLERALKINPNSQRARKGMHWAVRRLRHEQGEESRKEQISLRPNQLGSPGVDKPPERVSGHPVAAKPKTRLQVQKSPAQTIRRSAGETNSRSSRSPARFRLSSLAILVIAICVTTALVFWPGNASPVLAFLRGPHSLPAIPAILADVIKPTNTPSSTATSAPTATFTSAPTDTFTPTLTNTLTPTSTETPSPTPTFTPTDTPVPTSTKIPYPTNTPKPLVAPTGNGVKWIDVNLTKQMLYAYEGNKVVASFLVSTGVRRFPTVTGQYHIYIKLVSTLMAGDGYYLPNVPYTMYFYKGYGIHGTYWHHNFGHPMSHGCVNMYTPDAKWMFYWAPLGTLVNIHY